jgi:hypothetical protein
MLYTYIHSKESACIIISVRSGVLLNSDQGIRGYVGNASLFYSRLFLSLSLAYISSGRCVRPQLQEPTTNKHYQEEENGSEKGKEDCAPYL